VAKADKISGFESEYTIFVFLSMAYLTQHDDLQFYPFSYK
jgi:hypothetical protein